MGPRTSEAALANAGSKPQPDSDPEEECSWSWRDKAINGGTLRHVDLHKGSNGWASPPGDLFHLRAKGYFSPLSRRKKLPSGDWLLQPAGVDWLKSSSRLDHVLARPDNRLSHALRRAKTLGVAKKGSFIFAVNLQVPARPEAYSAVFYFASEEPIQPQSLLHQFIYGDDAYRNSRFKLVNRIVKGPWLVKAAVGNYAACLLGKALPIKYYRGEDYLEIDVDIGSSAIASAILSLALGCVTSVTIDMGFVVEAQQEEELPERLIGAVRIAQMEMKSACFVPSVPARDPAD